MTRDEADRIAYDIAYEWANEKQLPIGTYFGCLKNRVADAVVAAAKSNEIDEEKLNRLAAKEVKNYADVNGEAFDAYRAGYRRAALDNAISKLPPDGGHA